MSAVLRHLVSGATRRAGLPVVAPPLENGPLPGSVGGISRPFPSRGAGSGHDDEWASDGEEDSLEDAGEAMDFAGRGEAFVPNYQDDPDLLSFADLNNPQVSARRRQCRVEGFNAKT
jgi:hypothetical protein